MTRIIWDSPPVGSDYRPFLDHHHGVLTWFEVIGPRTSAPPESPRQVSGVPEYVPMERNDAVHGLVVSTDTVPGVQIKTIHGRLTWVPEGVGRYTWCLMKGCSSDYRLVQEDLP